MAGAAAGLAADVGLLSEGFDPEVGRVNAGAFADPPDEGGRVKDGALGVLGLPGEDEEVDLGLLALEPEPVGLSNAFAEGLAEAEDGFEDVAEGVLDRGLADMSV